ncbi:hypothetical protein BC833DRAFT_577804 [Globomyces pollinis-pini]|nr:hypothetical protein BC833DRAFT_577804 [Globomyces pollinis-pini]
MDINRLFDPESYQFQFEIPIFISASLGLVGSIWLYRNPQFYQTKNGFFCLISMVAIVDLLSSLSIMQLVIFGLFPDLVLYFLYVSTFLNLSISLVALYITKYHGSIENIHWKSLTCLCYIFGITAFFKPLTITSTTFYSILSRLSYILLASAFVLMFVSFFFTYRELSLQAKCQVYAARNYSIESSVAESHISEGTTLMIHFIQMFTLLNFFLWAPSIFLGCAFMYMYFDGPYFKLVSSVISFMYSFNVGLMGLKGLFHALGFHFGLHRKLPSAIEMTEVTTAGHKALPYAKFIGTQTLQDHLDKEIQSSKVNHGPSNSPNVTSTTIV